MGELLRGINSGWHGAVGDAVGRVQNGTTYLSALPTKSKKPPKQSQIDQRSIFAMTTKFLGKFDELLPQSYISPFPKLSSFNLAVRENLAVAVKGVSPNFSLDYSKIKLSNGEDRSVSNGAVEAVAGGKVRVSWSAAGEDDWPSKSDKVRLTDKGFLIAYDETEDWLLMKEDVTRSMNNMTLRLPGEMNNSKIHLWIIFVALDGKSSSRSNYLGSIISID
jgi:hypothetical protein